MEELHSTESMGETGENVAERYDVSREDQDAFALESHRRAVAAAEAGRFDDEIVTVDVPQREGRPGDRARRRGAAPGHDARAAGEAEADLPRGRHGHGRQLVVAQRRRGLPGAGERASARRELGREPLARIVATGSAGVDPGYMGDRPGARDAARRSSAPG